MCKCQNTCFSVDTVQNAPHLRVQHPFVRVLKGRHGIAEHSLDRRETGLFYPIDVYAGVKEKALYERKSAPSGALSLPMGVQ